MAGSKRIDVSKLIVTHNGAFHADECLAIYMLKTLDEYKNAKITRTRDPLVIDKADIVVDVGGVYDPKTNRFDHHQRSFTDTFDEKHKTTRLSSAGLIYKHFGKRAITEIVKEKIVDQKVIDEIYNKVYDSFIEGMDAIDNGVSQYPSNVSPAYIESTSLSKRVGRLNPWWNATEEVDVDQRFERAVQVTGEEFLDIVRSMAFSWIPARSIVVKALKERFSVDPSGKIIVLEQSCPWKEHLYTLEKELKLKDDQKPLYALYPDQSGSWRIQAVAVSPDSFESRKALPETWRGVRDDKLSELINIPGAIFVHATGFIGGNQTKEGALEMARKSL